MSPFQSIQSVNYTVIITRDMDAMRAFYQDVMCFPLLRELSAGWVEYRVGSNILALSLPGHTRGDAPVPAGTASVQLAFRVAPAMVAACADELARLGIAPVAPVTDQPFGHRTLFFRDPDGNLLEIYAEI